MVPKPRLCLLYTSWSTDFACAVLSQSGLLRSRHSTPAYKAYRGVTCAAFFPSRKGEPHYKASVGKLKKQLRDNVNDLYPAVAAQFFACFEEFVSCLLYTSRCLRSRQVAKCLSELWWRLRATTDPTN